MWRLCAFGAVGVALAVTGAFAADEADETAPAIVEPAGPLGLEEALALALLKSPALAEFSAATRAKDARTVQARKLPNPALDIRASRLDRARGADGTTEDGRLRVVVAQPIELGGKRKSRVDLARVERDVAGWDYEIERDRVMGQVTGQFAAVVGAERRVASSGRFLEFVEEMRERVDGLVASGTLRMLEVHLVARQVGLARIEHQQAESDLGTARFKLAATWGSVAPRFTEAVGELEPLAPLPELAAVLESAAESPAVARQAAEHARVEAALEVAEASRVPDLTLGAGARWEESSSERDYLFDFEITLPLFDRGQGNVQEARHQIEGAWAARRATQAATADGAAELYHALAEARVRAVTLGEEILPAVHAAFEAHRVAFDKGVSDIDDLIDARRELARAEADHALALVDYHQTRATLEALLGSNLDWILRGLRILNRHRLARADPQRVT